MAWNRILGLGALGLSAGASLRSLLGMKDLISDGFSKRKEPMHPAVVEVNVPKTAPDDDDEDLPQRGFAPRRLGAKIAEEAAPLGPPSVSEIAWQAVRRPFSALFKEPETPGPGVSDFLAGRTHANETAKPWFWPAAIGAAGLGGYGGYKAIDQVLGGLHKRDKQRDLEEAKEEYRKALVEQYSPEGVKAGAAQDELNRDLSELYTLYKQAGGLWDTAGTATGAYLALAGLLAGGTGLATYNWAKSRSSDERLAKAIKQRERLRWATRPPEIYAIARPAPVKLESDKPQYTPGDEGDEQTIHKYAARVASIYKS
jgi:hypothetical protein